MRVRAVIVSALLTTGSPRGAALRAQAPGTGVVTGRVTEARSGEPIAAATVTVQGSSLGAVTGRDGGYRIGRVPTGTRTISARRVGFNPGTRTIVVPDGGTVPSDFALLTSAIHLQEVVVTRTPGNQTRAAQGAPRAPVAAPHTTAQ